MGGGVPHFPAPQMPPLGALPHVQPPAAGGVPHFPSPTAGAPSLGRFPNAFPGGAFPGGFRGGPLSSNQGGLRGEPLAATRLTRFRGEPIASNAMRGGGAVRSNAYVYGGVRNTREAAVAGFSTRGAAVVGGYGAGGVYAARWNGAADPYYHRYGYYNVGNALLTRYPYGYAIYGATPYYAYYASPYYSLYGSSYGYGDGSSGDSSADYPTAPYSAGSTPDQGAAPKSNASTAELATPTDTRAYITIQAPEDAQIWFDDQPTTQTGKVRQFYSPPLTLDESYVIRAVWVQDGRTVESIRQVSVYPGDRITVDFTKPAKSP
jgi:uncharacterized protein (TIGR03000 family)